VSDELRIKQVLLNLLSNALKFTQKGSITILARLEQQRVLIDVIDTGIGIPYSDQDKLFKLFGFV